MIISLISGVYTNRFPNTESSLHSRNEFHLPMVYFLNMVLDSVF